MDITIEKVTIAYISALYGTLVIAGLCPLIRFAYRTLKPRVLFYGALAEHTFLPRRHARFQISHLQLYCLLSYIAANAIAIGLNTEDMNGLETRSAHIALFNLVLLSFAGHAHRLLEKAGFSLETYRFIHSWVGRITALDALLHVILIVIRRQLIDDLFKSGCVAAGSILCIFITSLWFPRRLRSLFNRLHCFFFLSTMVGLVWHVGFFKPTISSIVVGVSCALWLATQLSLLATISVRHYSGGLAKTVDDVWMDEVVTRVQLTGQDVSVFPGCYFYVYFPGPWPFMNLFRGHRMMPIADAEEAVSGKASTLDFLITNHGQHSRSVLGVRKGQDLLLIGPYGKDLQLHRYETVILTARGIGILGVLPFALHLAARKQQDGVVREQAARLRNPDSTVFRDVTRKVDLIWWLDQNSEEQWVADHLKSLQALDPENKLLVVWCIYPSPRAGPNPFKPNGHWQMLYNFDRTSLSRELKQEAKYPGRMIVTACGDQDFIAGVRDATMENSSTSRVIHFAPNDFRPGRHSAAFSNKTKTDTAHVTETNRNKI